MNGQIVRQLQAVEHEVALMAQLLKQGQDCLAVVRHGLAARQALSRIGLNLLAMHLHEQVNAALTCHDPACRARQVGQLTETYQTLTRFLCPACRGEWPVLAKCEDNNDSSSSRHHQ